MIDFMLPWSHCFWPCWPEWLNRATLRSRCISMHRKSGQNH